MEVGKVPGGGDEEREAWKYAEWLRKLSGEEGKDIFIK